MCIVNKYGSSTETYDQGLIGEQRVIRTKVIRDPESGGDVLPGCVLRLFRIRNEKEQTRRGTERKNMNPFVQDKTLAVSLLIAFVVAGLALLLNTQAVNPPPDGRYARRLDR